MIAVESSNIAALDWEATDEEMGIGTLLVLFKNGRTYRYLEVGRVRFDELTAPGVSVGKIFAAKIKGVYEFEEVTDE